MLSLADRVRSMSREKRAALYAALDRDFGPEAIATLSYEWEAFWARPDQVVARTDPWKLMVFTGPRGCGKSEAAIQLWLREILEGRARLPRLMSATEGDVHQLVEDRILPALPAHLRPIWSSSVKPAGALEFRGGILARGYPASAPEATVQTQGDLDLYDDVAKWGAPGAMAWKHARTSCRRGLGRGIVATTRRGTVILRKLLAGETATVRRPPDLFANRWNLTPGYFERMRRELGGDDFYQQELEDEDTSVSSPFGGIDFDAAPVRVLELLRSDFEEIAIGVDMAGGKGGGHDEWGIVAGGRRGDGHVVGLEDASGSFDDAEAGEAVLALAERWGATRVVVETNRGPGAITVINAAWQRRRAEGRTGRLHGLPELIGVVARDQKRLRAGELRPLYLGGTLHHGPGLAWLERQAREWDPDAPRRPRVDDRIDAWVHLVHYLARLAARGDAWGAAPIAQAAPPADPYRYQAPAPASDGWSDANPYSYAQPSGDPLRYT